MKHLFFSLLLISSAIFAGCSRPEQNVIYFAPNQLERVCTINNDILLNINNTVCFLDADLVNIADYPASESQNTHLFTTNEHCIGVHNENDTIYTITLSAAAFKTRLKINSFNQDMTTAKTLIETDAYDISNAIIGDSCCYYTVRESSMGGNGFSIMKVSLQENSKPELLWEDGGYDHYISIDSLHFYDNLLIFTVNYGREQTLNIYDAENDTWIIKNNTKMAYAAYSPGKLVYYNKINHSVEIYDIQKDTIIDSFKPTTTENVCISCDEDYIYIDYSQAMDMKENIFQIWIYDFKGQFIDLIELSDIIVADNPSKQQYYAAYMCSTKDLLFIGKQTAPYTNPIYVLKKSQIGAKDEPEIYSLTVF